VVWSLGHKWKSREIAAPATIVFEPEDDVSSAAHDSVGDDAQSDEFITGDTAFIQLHFKIPNFTMSDSQVRNHSFFLFVVVLY
jgi:hypothetical protein